MIRKYPLTLILVLAIWIVCMIPVPETPLDDVAFIDKWTHFVMYGSLSIVTWFEYWRNHKSGNQIYTLSSCLGIVTWQVVMGGAVELAQKYLTTCRSGDWFDFVCNSLGVLLGTAISLLAIAIYKRTVAKA